MSNRREDAQDTIDRLRRSRDEYMDKVVLLEEENKIQRRQIEDLEQQLSLIRVSTINDESPQSQQNRSSVIRSIYQPLKHADTIRLLILEPGQINDRIQCHFKILTLKGSRKPKYDYDAISYVWGPPLPTHKIFVDGTPHEIRDNLYHGLCRLRHRTKSRTLWADAICINQQDLQERNQQVRMMGTVYENSRFTLIWLGTKSGAEELALHLLKRVENTTKPDEKLLDAEQKNVAIPILFHDEPGGGPTAAHKYDSFLSLLRKSWFGRVWVLQEFTLSPDTLFICGDSSFHFESLALYWKFLFTGSSGQTETHTAALSLNSLLWFRSVHDEEGSLCLGESLFASFGRFSATDAKDQIFALMGLVDKQTRRELTIDYDCSVEDVFTEATAYCCLHSENPFALLSKVASVPPGQLRGVLPSWVPDFSSPAIFHRSFSNRPSFSADGDVLSEISVHGRVLEIVGKLVDDIVVCWERPSDESAVHVWNEWDRKCRSVFVNHGGPETYWRLMVCDLCFLDNEYHAADQGFGKYYLREDVSSIIWHNGKGSYDDPDLEAKRTLYNATVVMTSSGLNMCTTGKQRLGWVPPATQLGDKVCIFAGSKAPWIVRERYDGYYELIGDCFIDGIMYGEAVTWGRKGWDVIELI